MITTFFRSSSYNTYDFCPHKYFMDYVLGYRSPANKKAEQGTIVHKGLELLARKKLAQQNGCATFSDDEIGEFDCVELTPDKAIEIAYNHLTLLSPEYNWTQTDFANCHRLMWHPLLFNDGMFSPLKRTVLRPEQYFEFYIEKSWAEYSFKLPDGSKLEGYLGLRGTVDLIVKVEDQLNVLEYIDWKTGKRLDWNTGKEKTFEHLCTDSQLRIYYYALRRLYPEIEQILMTIFYIQDGGPFTLPFDDSDIPDIETMLKLRFQKIKDTVRPALIYPDWKCKRLCWFYKNNTEGEPVDTYNKSCCKTIKDELVRLGMDKVMAKRMRANALEYGEGGGHKSERT